MSIFKSHELILLLLLFFLVIFFLFYFIYTKIIEIKYKSNITINHGLINRNVMPKDFISNKSIIYSWISDKSKIDWVGVISVFNQKIYIFMPVTFIYGQWSFLSTCLIVESKKIERENYTIIKNIDEKWSFIYRVLTSRGSKIIYFEGLDSFMDINNETKNFYTHIFLNYKNVSIDVYDGKITIFFSGKIFSNILKVNEINDLVIKVRQVFL